MSVQRLPLLVVALVLALCVASTLGLSSGARKLTRSFPQLSTRTAALPLDGLDWLRLASGNSSESASESSERSSSESTGKESTSSSSQQCDKQGCGKIGDPCTGSFYDGSSCENAACCAYGLECVSGVNGTKFCARDTINASCIHNLHCASGEQCAGKVCVTALAAGDSCSKDKDCVGKLHCVNGTCQGMKKGENCDPTLYECEYGYYCDSNSNQCTPVLKDGKNCTSDDQCDWLSVCAGNKCHKLWSQKAGDACVPEDWEDSNCDFGLICDPVNDTCQHPMKKEVKKCTNSSDCDSGICGCDPFKGDFYCENPLYVDDCRIPFMDMLNCSAQHSCIMEDQIFLPGSCFVENCEFAIDAAVDCFCPELTSRVGDCVYFPLGGHCSSQSSNSDHSSSSGSHGHHKKGHAGLVVGLVILFIVIAAVLIGGAYWMYKKRQASYSTF